MSIQEKIIFEEDLRLAKSILGILNGSERYYIPNEYFPSDTKFNTKYNTFRKVSADDSKNGKRFTQTDVNMAGSNRWIIALADNSSVGKRYFISSPTEDSLKKFGVEKPNLNLYISMNERDTEPTEGDKKLTTFDYQITIVNTVLLTARALGIELQKFNNKQNLDNKTFLTEFIKEVAAKVGGKAAAFIPSDEFLKSFENAPYYKHMGNGNYMIISNSDVESLGGDINGVGDLTEPSFMTLFQEIKKKIAANVTNWRNAVKNKNLSDLYSSDKFDPLPGVMKLLYSDSTGGWHKSLRIKTEIYPKHTNTKFEKLGFLAANILKKKRIPNSKQTIMSRNPMNMFDVADLWGGKYSETEGFSTNKSFASHTGVIALRYKFDNRFYSVCGPIGSFRIDQISMKKIEREIIEYTLDDKWVGDTYENEGIALEDAENGNVENDKEEDSGDEYSRPPW